MIQLYTSSLPLPLQIFFLLFSLRRLCVFDWLPCQHDTKNTNIDLTKSGCTEGGFQFIFCFVSFNGKTTLQMSLWNKDYKERNPPFLSRASILYLFSARVDVLASSSQLYATQRFTWILCSP